MWKEKMSQKRAGTRTCCLALSPILGPPQFSLEKEVIKVPQGSNATGKRSRDWR